MSLGRRIILIGILLSQSVLAQITVHITNPWQNDTCAKRRDSLHMFGNEEVGWSGGISLTPEGGGWFYYSYQKHSVNFTLDTWCGNASWDGAVSYKRSFNLDSLLALFPAGTIEIWIQVKDTTQIPKVYDRPPGGKVLYVFNPWPDNSPQMIVGDRIPIKMRPTPGLCGWYTGYYAGPLDSLWNVKFTDYFHTQKYTASGMASGPGIDVRSILTKGDTVYILPKPFPYGVPSLTATFPGKTGECGYRKVSGLFRDWKQDDVSFFNNPMGMSGGGNKGMVQTTLVASNDYKPLKTTDPSVNMRNLGHLETWYVIDTFPAGSSRRTNDTCIDIELKKGEDGRWEFDSDVKSRLMTACGCFRGVTVE